MLCVRLLCRLTFLQSLVRGQTFEGVCLTRTHSLPFRVRSASKRVLPKTLSFIVCVALRECGVRKSKELAPCGVCVAYFTAVGASELACVNGLVFCKLPKRMHLLRLFFGSLRCSTPFSLHVERGLCSDSRAASTHATTTHVQAVLCNGALVVFTDTHDAH